MTVIQTEMKKGMTDVKLYFLLNKLSKYSNEHFGDEMQKSFLSHQKSDKNW